MFAILPDLTSGFSQDKLIAGVIRYINTSIDGNVNEFARLLQFKLENVVDWLKRKHFPSFNSLLEISWYFRIPLLNLLLGINCEGLDTTPLGESKSKAEMEVISTKRRNKLSEEELKNFESYLQ